MLNAIRIPHQMTSCPEQAALHSYSPTEPKDTATFLFLYHNPVLGNNFMLSPVPPF